MTVWDDLRAEILRLRDERPSPLTQHPDPRHDDQPLPAQIGLAAWASDQAARLRQRFGDDVHLTVGAMSYPDATDRPTPHNPAPTATPDELTVELAAPLTISSGHNASTHVLITNHTAATIALNTNGTLIADITDPRTGATVGGYAGPMTLQLVTFSIQPAATVRIPLLVGTDSRIAALGHAIPPGHWAMHATLTLRDGRRLRTPPLPLTID